MDMIALAAVAALGGVCAAETLLLWEALRLLREVLENRGQRAREEPAGPEAGISCCPQAGLGWEHAAPAEEHDRAEEETLRSAAMQEGFDNLMRYTVGTARREQPH